MGRNPLGPKRTEGHAAVGIISLPIPTTRGTEVCFIFHLMPYLKQVKLKIGDKGRN